MTPYYQDDSCTIYHGDCFDVLPELPKVSLVLTDPPYGIGWETPKDRKRNARTTKYAGGVYGKDWGPIVGDDASFDPRPFLGKGHKTILWGANHYASRLPDSGGWLIWDKKRGATVGRGFASSDVELAWTDWLSSTKLYIHLWHGLYRDSEIGLHYHPTQKPTELFRWCIDTAGDVETVLDPFMGSGTTLRAAKDLAAKRLAQEVLAL